MTKPKPLPKPKPRSSANKPPPPTKAPKTRVIKKSLVLQMLLTKLESSKTCDWHALSLRLNATSAKPKRGKAAARGKAGMSGSDLHELYHNFILPGLKAGRTLWEEGEEREIEVEEGSEYEEELEEEEGAPPPRAEVKTPGPTRSSKGKTPPAHSPVPGAAVDSEEEPQELEEPDAHSGDAHERKAVDPGSDPEEGADSEVEAEKPPAKKVDEPIQSPSARPTRQRRKSEDSDDISSASGDDQPMESDDELQTRSTRPLLTRKSAGCKPSPSPPFEEFLPAAVRDPIPEDPYDAFDDSGSAPFIGKRELPRKRAKVDAFGFDDAPSFPASPKPAPTTKAKARVKPAPAPIKSAPEAALKPVAAPKSDPATNTKSAPAPKPVPKSTPKTPTAAKGTAKAPPKPRRKMQTKRESMVTSPPAAATSKRSYWA